MSLSIALVHHPVRDRQGLTVTTAITNLDLHDMARSARTYGAAALYVVHPIDAQRALAHRIRQHWVEGSGRLRIPDRAFALDALRVSPTLAEVYSAMGGRDQIDVWTTAAKAHANTTSFDEARNRLAAGRETLLLFGTGWGLTEELLDSADVRLAPIQGPSDYNHLSVRAACAIALDRLFGR